MRVAEGESATFRLLTLAKASIVIFIVKMYHLLYHQMIGLDELIFYISPRACVRAAILLGRCLTVKN